MRLLVGDPSCPLTLPDWAGNEFLYDDGTRPIIRTFTPRRWDAEGLTLDLDVVLHPHGSVSGWAETVDLGAPAAISGPGRGYVVDENAARFLLAGDETAVPAIVQLLESIPRSADVDVIVEVTAPDARLGLTDRRDVSETWVVRPDDQPPGESLIETVRTTPIGPGTKVWAAGEAAAMFQIRKHLFDEAGLSRSDVTVRGYWKLR